MKALSLFAKEALVTQKKLLASYISSSCDAGLVASVKLNGDFGKDQSLCEDLARKYGNSSSSNVRSVRSLGACKEVRSSFGTAVSIDTACMNEISF